MDSMEKIISSMRIHLGVRGKLKPFSRIWSMGGSKVTEDKFIFVLELEEGAR